MKQKMFVLILILLFGFTLPAHGAGTISGNLTSGTAELVAAEQFLMVTGRFDTVLAGRLSTGLELGFGELDDRNLSLMDIHTNYEFIKGVALRIGYQTLNAFDYNFSGFRGGIGLAYDLVDTGLLKLVGSEGGTDLQNALSGLNFSASLDYFPHLEAENGVGKDIGEHGLGYRLQITYAHNDNIQFQGGYRGFQGTIDHQDAGDRFAINGFFVGTGYSF